MLLNRVGAAAPIMLKVFFEPDNETPTQTSNLLTLSYLGFAKCFDQMDQRG